MNIAPAKAATLFRSLNASVACSGSQTVPQVMSPDETALVLRGKQGTGKTKVGEVLCLLLGAHYALVAEATVERWGQRLNEIPK